MNITTLPADQLTTEQCAAWSNFQLNDRTFESPYFRPEFTQAVAAVRNDVEVAVLEEEGEPVGFFPFQRTKWNAGIPVGGTMSDFHGVICRQGLSWNAAELIRGCGLAAWDFNHLLEAQQPFQPYHWKTSPSPYMDLSGGFDAYRATTQGQTISQVLRKTRKLEREVGPLRLEASSNDPEILKTVIQWKIEQYRRTNAVNIFALDWTTALLEHIHRAHHPAFSGMLTALYAGDQLAAVHMGMRSSEVLHCWFPAYNQDLHKYSPGLILWTELAQAAQALDIRRVDFGRGAGQYKTSLMSGAIQVAEGFVATSPLAGLVRHSSRRAKEWIRGTPLRTPARLLRRVHSWLTFVS